MFKLYKLKDYSFRLVLWLVVISGIGVMLVGSAMKSLQPRQLFGVILGLAVMTVVSLIDFSWILNEALQASAPQRGDGRYLRYYLIGRADLDENFLIYDVYWAEL